MKEHNFNSVSKFTYTKKNLIRRTEHEQRCNSEQDHASSAYIYKQ